MAIGNLETEAQLSAFVQRHIDNVLGRLAGPRPYATFAGAPTDAGFARTPPNGTPAVDKTNNRLYVRVNGAWRYTALT